MLYQKEFVILPQCEEYGNTSTKKASGLFSCQTNYANHSHRWLSNKGRNENNKSLDSIAVIFGGTPFGGEYGKRRKAD